MSNQPIFSDTARIRMQQFDLAEWQVLRAFESSDKTYKDNHTTVGRAIVDGKLITVTYAQNNQNEYVIITCWVKDAASLDEKYQQNYHKYPPKR